MGLVLYIHPDTPQVRLINQAVAIIRNGGVIIYPTDSGYALGCQMGDKNALDKICHIRKIDKKHNFTLLCRDLSEISLYSRVDNVAFRLIRNNTPGAYTFILRGTKEVPRRLLNAKRKTIGIRVPDNPIALALLEALGEPLMSTSLILPGDDFTQYDPEEIEMTLNNRVALFINSGYLTSQPTTVVDFTGDNIEIIREGAGKLDPFQ